MIGNELCFEFYPQNLSLKGKMRIRLPDQRLEGPLAEKPKIEPASWHVPEGQLPHHVIIQVRCNDTVARFIPPRPSADDNFIFFLKERLQHFVNEFRRFLAVR